MEQKKITLPKGWEIDKVEGNEIILKESKKELPKTWKECYKLLRVGECIEKHSDIIEAFLQNPIDSNKNVIPVGLGKPMLALMQLLVCRQVYRQGWKPDWNDCNSNKYCIESFENSVKRPLYQYTHRILSFQSAEVRDKFLENFHDLIKEAKELI